MAEAFRWSAMRMVTRTATVSLAGNRYQVDPSLAGRRVELRYDPEDPTRLTVFVEGAAVGTATPFTIGRHTHPQVPQAARPQPQPTGIDYLGLVQTAHQEATIGQIAYRDLPLPGLEALSGADHAGDGDHDDPAEADR
jgi:putative transposase